jgi:hypothetical protein
MTRSYASISFVEDSIIFLATFIPIVYFFKLSPIVIASAAHFLSIPCAALAHCDIIQGLETYVLILVVSFTTLLDAGVALFCAYQFARSELFCEFLELKGSDCLQQYNNIPVAVFLLPVSLFNVFRGCGRIADVLSCASVAARKYAGSAGLTAILGVYLAALVNRSIEDSANYSNDLLLISVIYALAVVVIGAVTTTSPVGGFFATHLIVIVQTYATINGELPSIFMAFGFSALAVALGSASSLDYFEDKWTTAYCVLATAAATFVAVQSWDSLRPVSGTLLVAYFCSLTARSVVLKHDWYDVSMYGAIPLALLDAAAFVRFFFFGDSLQIKIVAILIAAMSLAVVIVTGVASWWSKSQVDELMETKALGSKVPSFDDTIFSELTDLMLTNALTAGKACGALVEEALGPEMRKDVIPAERVEDKIFEKDKLNFIDPRKAYSLRERIIFIRSVMARLKNSINTKVAAQVVKSICAKNGVPTQSYTDADTKRASWSLDIKWAPFHTTTSLDALIALRNSASPDDDLKTITKEINQRYKFIASRKSYRFFDSSQRYQAHWNIVWN